MSLVTSPATVFGTSLNSSEPSYSTEEAAQVAAMVQALGISSSQAEQDLRVERLVGGFNESVEADLGAAFAGVWFDPWHATFDIGTAPAVSQNMRSALESAVADAHLSGVTRLVPVKATYQELRAAQSGWSQRVGELMARGEAMTELDPATNSVVVTVKETAPTAELDKLGSEIAQANTTEPAHAWLRRVPQSHMPLAPTTEVEPACRFQADNIDYCNPPLVGGTEIFSQAGSDGYVAICTAGFMAVSIDPADYPDHYLLTAGHCFEGERIYETGPWNSANAALAPKVRTIGYLNYRIINASGDAAFINLTDNWSYWLDGPGSTWYPWIYTPGAHWGPNGQEYYPINIVGTNDPPNVQYQTPCHTGWHTGVQCGVTEAVGVEAMITYESGPKLVGSLVRNSACVLPGDSGGPWIYYNYAMGLTVAGGRESCIGSLFDDEHTIDHALGMRVVGFQGSIE